MRVSVSYQRGQKAGDWFPANPAEERAALGACILGHAVEGVQLLVAADFSTEAHKKIFAAIAKLVADGETALEISLLAAELRRRGELSQVCGESYLIDLLDGVVMARKMASRARALRELAERRKLLHIADEVCKRSRDWTVPVNATKDWLRGAAQ